jgi:hypothetical protein
MKKIYIFENYNLLLKKYNKLSKRLKQQLETGSFWRISFEKRNSLMKKLIGIRNKLSVLKPSLKPVAGAAALVLSLGINAAVAQSFTAQTGASNPLQGVTGVEYSLNFVDIDGDKDLDIVGSTSEGSDLKFYKNTGTISAPAFEDQGTTNANPFASIPTVGYIAPSFGDLDNDGDIDMVIGEDLPTGMIRFFKNTGSSTNPVFTEQTGPDNPFDSFTELGDELMPTLVDLDGDGDLDLFVGEEDDSKVMYFKNTGTKDAPAFIEQTGTDNPFADLITDYRPQQVFADVDSDGDLDAMITYPGYYSNGGISYFKNTGTATNFVFEEQKDAANTFGTIDTYFSPSFADLDNDGDKDMIVASGYDGTMEYYINNHQASKLAPTITFSTVTKTFGDAAFSVSASSNAPGAISYSITSGSDFASITSEGLVTITGAGTVTIEASQAASAEYNAGTTTTTLTINKATPTLAYTGVTSGVQGTSIDLGSSTNSTGLVTYQVVSGGTGSASVDGTSLNLTAPGTVTIEITIAASTNYASKTITQDIEISALSTSVISAHALNIKMDVYPNPAPDHINVKLEGNLSAVTSLIVTDMNGRLIKTSDGNVSGSDFEYTISTSDLTEGIYLLKVQTPEGMIVKKFTK